MTQAILLFIFFVLSLATAYYWGRQDGFRKGNHFGYRQGHTNCLLSQRLIKKAAEEEISDFV